MTDKQPEARPAHAASAALRPSYIVLSDLETFDVIDGCFILCLSPEAAAIVAGTDAEKSKHMWNAVEEALADRRLQGALADHIQEHHLTNFLKETL